MAQFLWPSQPRLTLRKSYRSVSPRGRYTPPLTSWPDRAGHAPWEAVGERTRRHVQSGNGSGPFRKDLRSFRRLQGLVPGGHGTRRGDGRLSRRPGTEDSRRLSRQGTLAYASESMRLTTRLMQIASWLLVQRAVAEGEITPAQAQQEKNRVRLQATGASTTPVADFEALPARLRELIGLLGPPPRPHPPSRPTALDAAPPPADARQSRRRPTMAHRAGIQRARHVGGGGVNASAA